MQQSMDVQFHSDLEFLGSDLGRNKTTTFRNPVKKRITGIGFSRQHVPFDPIDGLCRKKQEDRVCWLYGDSTISLPIIHIGLMILWKVEQFSFASIEEQLPES